MSDELTQSGFYTATPATVVMPNTDIRDAIIKYLTYHMSCWVNDRFDDLPGCYVIIDDVWTEMSPIALPLDDANARILVLSTTIHPKLVVIDIERREGIEIFSVRQCVYRHTDKLKPEDRLVLAALKPHTIELGS